MKLIADWRQSWRLWSVRVSALGALLTAAAAASPDALLGVWSSLPDEVRGMVSDHIGRWIVPFLFVASLVVRVIRQREVADDR